jgi:hypothetical protein
MTISTNIVAALILSVFLNPLCSADSEKKPVSGAKSETPSQPAVDAGFCPVNNASAESSYDYLLAVIDSLAEVRSGIEIVQGKRTKGKRTDAQVMGDFIEAKKHLGCSIKHVEAFSGSKSDEIRTSAAGIDGASTKLIGLVDEEKKIYKNALNGEGDLRPGTIAEHQGQLSNDFEEAYQLLTAGAIAATFATLEKDSKGDTTHALTITKTERDAVLAKIAKNFGPLKTQKNHIEASAGALKKFLNDKWTSKKESH